LFLPLQDKIDLFFKIIDTDGNGLLSYDEVLDISFLSLRRSMQGTEANENVTKMLSEYFANLIFYTCWC